MCRRVETNYKESPDEAERLETVARILSEGVYAYLKTRGLLAAHGPRVTEQTESEDHKLGGEDSP